MCIVLLEPNKEYKILIVLLELNKEYKTLMVYMCVDLDCIASHSVMRTYTRCSKTRFDLVICPSTACVRARACVLSKTERTKSSLSKTERTKSSKLKELSLLCLKLKELSLQN